MLWSGGKDGGFRWHLDIEGFFFYVEYINAVMEEFRSFLPQLVASSGKSHQSLLLPNGHVYVSGSNNYGELGIGSEVDKSLLGSERMILHQSAMSVVCGDSQTSVITVDGDVYTCGHGIEGRLGVSSDEDPSYPSHMVLDLPAVKVASGKTLTAVLLQDGSVFTTGTNLPTDDPYGEYLDEEEYEDLQHEQGEDDNEPLPKPSSSIPIRIKLPLPAIDIACGENWVIAILQDGSVCGWGDNIVGQLGVRNPRKRDNPGVSREDLSFRIEPVPMDLPMGQKAKSVACGFQHTIVLMEDGSVYGCGENNYRQLGAPELEPLPWSYSLLRMDIPQPAVSVTCGRNNTFCITEEGEVYACGVNTRGELGLGDDVDYFTNKSPHRMEIQGRVQSVVAGDYSTIVILEDDSVFTAGAVNCPRTSYPVRADVIGELAIYLS